MSRLLQVFQVRDHGGSALMASSVSIGDGEKCSDSGCISNAYGCDLSKILLPPVRKKVQKS